MTERSSRPRTHLAEQAAERLAELTGVERHDVALVLGSGWLPAVDALGEATAEISTTDLPGFSAAAVAGHSGKIRSIRVAATATCWSSSAAPTTTRARASRRSCTACVRRPRAGCRAIVLTNGCGGLKETLDARHAGADQRPHQPHRPVADRGRELRRPDRPLQQPAARDVPRGGPDASTRASTCSSPGPHYETPAEIGMVRAIGGHLVGMSTTLEAIAAREAGMEVLGISLVTNLAAGISGEPLNHEEVLEAGRAAASRMGDLLGRIVPQDLMRVLVTGAAGSIGRVVTVGLTDRGHSVVGLDRVPAARRATTAPGTPSTAPTPTPSPRSSTSERLDAVVHLAGHPGEANLPDSLDLARGHDRRAAGRDGRARRRRIVYASSNHAVGRTPRARPGRPTTSGRGRTRSTASARSPPRR